MDNNASCIIQNGATSAVGMRVIQIAKGKGIKTINIIRDSINSNKERKARLYGLGADYVYTETEVEENNNTIKALKPELGLNCVGGKGGSKIQNYLKQSGTLITYGGMSGLPVFASTSAMIFKDIKFKGFWMTEWYKQHTLNDRQAMYDALYEMRRNGCLSDLEGTNIIEWDVNDEKSNDVVLNRIIQRCDGSNPARLMVKVI